MSIPTKDLLNGKRCSVELIIYSFRTHGRFPALPDNCIQYSVRASESSAVRLDVDIEIAAVIANEMYVSCTKCSDVMDEPLFLYSNSTLKVVYAATHTPLDSAVNIDSKIDASLKNGSVAICVQREDVKFVQDGKGNTLMRLFPSENIHLPLLCFDYQLYEQYLTPSTDSNNLLNEKKKNRASSIRTTIDKFLSVSRHGIEVEGTAADDDRGGINALELLQAAIDDDSFNNDNCKRIMKHATELIAETCVWYATEASKEKMSYFNPDDQPIESMHLADTMKLLYVEAYLKFQESTISDAVSTVL